MSGNDRTGEAGPKSAPLRFFGGIVGGMNAAGSCWIMVLMILIILEVVFRGAFNAPIIGVIEMIEISIIGIVFLQLADSLRRGVLTRSDGLFNQVMNRSPLAGHIMGVMTYLLGAVFMGLVLWGYAPTFVDAWQKDYYVGVEGMFTAPVWPISGIVVISIVVTMVQFAIMLADHIRAICALDKGDAR